MVAIRDTPFNILEFAVNRARVGPDRMGQIGGTNEISKHDRGR